MVTVSIFETSVNFDDNVWRNIPKDTFKLAATKPEISQSGAA